MCRYMYDKEKRKHAEGWAEQCSKDCTTNCHFDQVSMPRRPERAGRPKEVEEEPF